MRYKLGQLIEQYDEINDKGEFQDLESLQGINSLKYFQECKSNKNDIDLYRYRICRKGMFAYNRATSRNGEKISIAYREGDDCLISPSYYCFKIVREDLLLADYLMIWLKRPVFDKYARFHSWGSATEFFTFEDFCDTEIVLPSIETQRKIVHDYKVIIDRIELLKKINENLEKQAYIIYDSEVKDSTIYCKIEDIGTFVRGKNITSEEMVAGE
ncbi:MAG: restriction endonuclease subunit S, partial [Paludibacteraceae bacterium]|nr:restriction endonuclease subunit S [Paludibacteraceae bacterium]